MGTRPPIRWRTLAELAEFDPDRVEQELKRLSDSEVRVLRDRSYEGKVFYELYHDRFISFIGPWREKVLQDDKRRTMVEARIINSFRNSFSDIFAYSEWKIINHKKYTDGKWKN